MSKHKSVLLNESIDSLNLSEDKVFLDGTVGSGGHSALVAEKWGSRVRIIGLDRDPLALKRSAERLESLGAKFDLRQANFRDLDKVLHELDIESVDAILLDLGFSSDQLEDSGRGFSFLRDEPLDMRMGDGVITAATILNTFEEETLELILRGFGEEKQSKRIAEEIVRRRIHKPFETTFDLVSVVEIVLPYSKRTRIHPATRTFQALRIAVNEELDSLEKGLEKGFEFLSADGRFSVISFHSLEDRIVKNFFRDKKTAGEAELLTKKPLTASDAETKENPRARSAKLRTLRKL